MVLMVEANTESMENEPKLACIQQMLQSTRLAPEPAKVTEDSVGEVGGVLKGRGVSKQSIQDGIISSEDIINSGFEWQCRMVVMSACDTYRGKVQQTLSLILKPF